MQVSVNSHNALFLLNITGKFIRCFAQVQAANVSSGKNLYNSKFEVNAQMLQMLNCLIQNL